MCIRRCFVAICALCMLWVAGADNLHWLSTEYDFGTIHEESGKAHGQVQFVNMGPEATIIQRVKSTCGCTGVGHTEGIIAPGDTATVWFDYNPAGRPGRFEKHVKAYTGVDGDLTSITIKGTVIGAPHSLDSKYPISDGGLRLSDNVIPMGRTLMGTSRHEYLHGYNQSADTLLLSWKDVPRYISLGVSSKSVAPGDLFTLSAYMNTRDGAEIGSMDIPFVLMAQQGDTTRTITIHVTAQIEPDTSALSSEELLNAPSATVFPTILDLGEVIDDKGGSVVEVALRNEGKSPLQVRRVHCTEIPTLVQVKSMPTTLKPEAMKQVRLSIDKGQLPQGDFKIPIEVVTNDPIHPTRYVYIIGTRP